jgi:hypothetical protein
MLIAEGNFHRYQEFPPGRMLKGSDKKQTIGVVPNNRLELVYIAL